MRRSRQRLKCLDVACPHVDRLQVASDLVCVLLVEEILDHTLPKTLNIDVKTVVFLCFPYPSTAWACVGDMLSDLC